MDKLNSKKLEKIGIFGPHDRINYGDFLFPMMLEHAISKLIGSKIQLKKYSLISADYSHLKAFKSKSYRDLISDVNNREINVVIVAGGESISAKWNNLYSYINPLYDFFYQIKKIRYNRIFRNIPKFLFGNKTEFPFIINEENYKVTDLQVFYNAVGGGRGLNKNQMDTLRAASLVGLRDNSSYEFITRVYNDDKFILVPDSAIILSDVYPKNKLERVIKDDYVFFQLSNHKHQNKVEFIVNQLKKILEKDLKIVLCPLGTAKGHEDQIVLKQIYNQLKDAKVILIDKQPTIPEIIGLIANAQLYIGTSLHGVITSMSYGVPYIPLNLTQNKVVSFLETWSIPELNHVYELESFYDKFNEIFSLNLNDKILTNTNILKQKYYDFVEKIVKAL